MNVCTDFEELPRERMAFTIGNFDGVHLGHQALLAKLRSYGVPTCVLTFVEHPFTLLKPTEVPPIITPFPIKQSLFNTDFCLLLPFTPELASMTYDQLLNRLAISHLVLGKDSRFGRRREGTEAAVRAWGADRDVHIEYIDKVPGVSSTEIRAAIERGDLACAAKLLGRPHMLYVPSQRFLAPNVALPPDGTYALVGGALVGGALAGANVRIVGQSVEVDVPIEQPSILSFKESYV